MDLTCPHCGCGLASARAASTTVWACASCGGLWLDNVASQKLVEAIDPATLSLADAASRMAAMPFPPHQARPRCPVCRGELQGVTVQAAGVSLDTCNLHGTWFDRGELQAVARVFAATRNTQATPRAAGSESMAAAVATEAFAETAGDLAAGAGLGLLEILFEAILSGL